MLNSFPKLKGYPFTYYLNSFFESSKSELKLLPCPLASWVHCFASHWAISYPLDSFTKLVPIVLPNERIEVVTKQTTADDILKFYLQHGVHIDEKISNMAHILKKIKTYIKEVFTESQTLHKYFNEYYGISTRLVYQIKDNQIAAAIGDISSFEPPLITWGLPPLEIKTEENLENILNIHFDSRQKLLNKDFKEFVMAHEFRHIMNKDCLAYIISYYIQNCLKTLPFIINWSLTQFPVQYFFYSYIESILLGTIYDFTNKFFQRYQEKRADLEAIESLPNGLQAFDQISQVLNNEDYYHSDDIHPTVQDRLAYLKPHQIN